jgi:hypothetical protein
MQCKSATVPAAVSSKMFKSHCIAQRYGKVNRVTKVTSTSQKTCLDAHIQCFREEKLIEDN